MTLVGWIQIVSFFALVAVTAPPIGIFMARVFMGERTFLHPVLEPIERGFYWLAGVDSNKGQDWRAYTIAMLMFSLVGFRSGLAGSFLQYRRQLPDQHELAKLQR